MNVLIKAVYYQYKEIINYLIFGVLTTVVNFVTYFICSDLMHIQYLISNLIAWFLSVLFAYVTNRRYVFESKSESVVSEMIKFFGSRMTTGVLDMFFMWLLISIFCLHEMFSKIFVNVLVVIANYILSKLVVFKKG